MCCHKWRSCLCGRATPPNRLGALSRNMASLRALLIKPKSESAHLSTRPPPFPRGRRSSNRHTIGVGRSRLAQVTMSPQTGGWCSQPLLCGSRRTASSPGRAPVSFSLAMGWQDCKGTRKASSAGGDWECECRQTQGMHRNCCTGCGAHFKEVDWVTHSFDKGTGWEAPHMNQWGQGPPKFQSPHSVTGTTETGDKQGGTTEDKQSSSWWRPCRRARSTRAP